MSDRMIEMGVTVKDIVLLFGACIVATAVFYTIMVSLVGWALIMSLEVPVERSNGLECVSNCSNYAEMLQGL